MDYFAEIKKQQEDFIKNPRKNIEKLVRTSNEQRANLPVEFLKKNLDIARTYLKFSKEYSIIIGEMLKRNELNVNIIKDDLERVLMAHRIKEQTQVISDYLENKKPAESIALSMAKAYATTLEIFWKILKKVVFYSGLNPEDKHLTIWKLKEKIEQLELRYSLSLPNIKSLLESQLRNSIDHENTFYEPPNLVVFMNKKGSTAREIGRFTTHQLYKEIIQMDFITTAMARIENIAVVSYVEPLLKLSDAELREFAKTGKLTTQQREKTYGKKT